MRCAVFDLEAALAHHGRQIVAHVPTIVELVEESPGAAGQAEDGRPSAAVDRVDDGWNRHAPHDVRRTAEQDLDAEVVEPRRALAEPSIGLPMERAQVVARIAGPIDAFG